MKSTKKTISRTLSAHFRHVVILAVLLCSITIAAKAQYYTKITVDPLVETPKVTYSASWGDYNNDGWDDMVVIGNEGKTTLYRNNTDGSFTADTLNSIFTTAGPGLACAWGDYNNDGNVDLYVCNTGNSGPEASKNFLFRNDGNGVFTRITDGEIVNDMGWSVGAAWADYDNDGYLDLFVANFHGINFLYHNSGDGTFTKITEGDIVNDNYDTYCAAWCDYDNDGFQDLYVVNYFYSSVPGQNNNLYHNNGDGTFTSIYDALIVNDLATDNGASWGDFNNDGNMDLYVTMYDGFDVKHNMLYKNEGNGNFTALETDASKASTTSYGAAWLDVNNDGYLDMYVSNNGSTTKRKNSLYINNGNETFSSITSDASTLDALIDFSTSVADYDHNGYPDIFTPSYSKTLMHGLYKNNGGSNNYITLRLNGVYSNRSAIGARIACYANGMVQWREVSSTSGYHAGSSFAQTFGIGAATEIDSICVKWPSGAFQKITKPSINQILKITEVSNLANITSFELAEQKSPATIDKQNHTVNCVVVYGTDVTALKPNIGISGGASISPASGDAIDFSSGSATYTVTAENLTTAVWTVNITIGPKPNFETDILTFLVSNQVGTSEINTVNHTINAEVAYGTSLAALAPVYTLSAGATAVPASGATTDFSKGAVEYTVTAENEVDTQVWTVNVKAALNPATDILTFTLDNLTAPAVIDPVKHTITAEVPYGTAINALAPVVTLSAGATVAPVSGTAVDFSKGAVEYTVTAENAVNTQVWTVTVKAALNNATDILTFVLDNLVAPAVIDAVNHTVTAEVMNTYSISALTPVITLSDGATVTPASGTAVDFSNGAVTFTVKAENTTDMQDWTVLVTINTVGLKTNELPDGVQIYPNPTTSLIHIKGIIDNDLKVEIINSNGQVIHTETYQNKSNAELQYSFEGKRKGVYIVKLTTAKSAKSFQVVVK